MKQVASVSSRSAVFRTLVVWALLTTAVLIPFFFWADDVQAYFESLLAAAEGNRALVALILFAVLVGDLFLPVPSCLASALCGAFLGPWLGFWVSFAAMGVSAAAGYLLGRFFAAAARRVTGTAHAALEVSGAVWGPRLLLVMRPLPVLSECSAVYAGLCRWPVGACFAWTMAGNAGISAVYAGLGYVGRASDSPLPAFGAVIALSALAFIFDYVRRERR
jgi:uncharacterized membrane protein YdjX (TVP38/TMEM64 family)